MLLSPFQDPYSKSWPIACQVDVAIKKHYISFRKKKSPRLSWHQGTKLIVQGMSHRRLVCVNIFTQIYPVHTYLKA